MFSILLRTFLFAFVFIKFDVINAGVLATINIYDRGDGTSVNSIPGSIDIRGDQNEFTQQKQSISRDAELLGSEITAGKNQNDLTSFKELSGMLHKKHDFAALSQIYAEAIDSSYNRVPTDKLATFIWYIFKEDDLQSFRTMTQLQLDLLYKFKGRGDVNDAYLRVAGYYLQKIQKNVLHQKLDSNVQRRLRNAVNELPSSLYYLYFKPEFCLLNKAHKEYIYIGVQDNIADRRRYVWTWNDPSAVEKEGIWIANITQQNDLDSVLTVKLKSKHYQVYLYLDSDYDNKVLGWLPGDAPATSAWNVQLVENQLVFRNADSIVCASNKFHEDKHIRRYVNGFHYENDKENKEECQWVARDCDYIKYSY